MRLNTTLAIACVLATSLSSAQEDTQTKEKPVEIPAELKSALEHLHPKHEKAGEKKEIADENKPADPADKTKKKPETKHTKEATQKIKHLQETNKILEGSECAITCQEQIEKINEEFQSRIDELNERIAELENAQEGVADEIESLHNQPSEELLAKINFLCVGTAYTFFTIADDENSTFGTVIDPVFLWRCGDDLLFEMKLDITLPECDTDINLVYGTTDYVVNDCLTVRAGKYTLPLGLVWEKMTTGWINKLPTLPLPYNPRFAALLPAADIGVDLRGAFYAGYWFCSSMWEKIPAVIVWDLWVGNGPSEDIHKNIALDCNFPDNNYNKAVGGRIGLRPQPFREIGFAAERARWNNNHNAGCWSGKRHRYYNAFVVDLNWRLTEDSRLMGEFIWTKFDAKKNKKFGIDGDEVYQIGWWLQYSTFLTAIGRNYCWFTNHPFWNDTEFVLRGGAVSSDICRWSRQQVSVGLNYYISNILILKGAYDCTHGHLLSDNRFTVQLAVAY